MILFALLVGSVSVQALRPGYVYDRARVLSSDEVLAIDYFCEEFERNYTSEIVVVSLANLSQYGGSMSVARETIFNDESLDGLVGIGKSNADNGVLIVISIADREWGIEVGYGLEGSLTDSEAGRIGRDIMVPYLREGDYYMALFSGAMAVGDEIKGVSSLPVEEPTYFGLNETDIIIIVVFVVIFMIFFLIGGRGGRSRSHRRYGGWGGGYGGGGSGGGGSGGGGSGGGGAGGRW